MLLLRGRTRILCKIAKEYYECLQNSSKDNKRMFFVSIYVDWHVDMVFKCKKKKDFTYAENAVSKNAFSCKKYIIIYIFPPISAIAHALALDEKNDV